MLDMQRHSVTQRMRGSALCTHAVVAGLRRVPAGDQARSMTRAA